MIKADPKPIKIEKVKKPKEPKQKPCCICTDKFTPFQTTDVVCAKYDCRVSYAMRIVEKNRKAKKKAERKAASDNRKQKTAKKRELMSNDEYRAKVVQPVINEIARLIDYGQPCIATGNYGKENGGHYRSVGSNRTTALNLHNIFIQAFESNHFKSGDNVKFKDGLIKTYGKDYFEFVDGLIATPPQKWLKNDLMTFYGKATAIRSRLKSDLFQRTPNERIELRNQINIELGIYPTEFCEFQYDVKLQKSS